MNRSKKRIMEKQSFSESKHIALPDLVAKVGHSCLVKYSCQTNSTQQGVSYIHVSMVKLFSFRFRISHLCFVRCTGYPWTAYFSFNRVIPCWKERFWTNHLILYGSANKPPTLPGPQINVFDRFLLLGGSKWAEIVPYEQGVPLRRSGHPTCLY